jgi:hypothetical protein
VSTINVYRVHVRDPRSGREAIFPTSARSPEVADDLGRRAYAGAFSSDEERASLEVTCWPVERHDEAAP